MVSICIFLRSASKQRTQRWYQIKPSYLLIIPWFILTLSTSQRNLDHQKVLKSRTHLVDWGIRIKDSKPFFLVRGQEQGIRIKVCFIYMVFYPFISEWQSKWYRVISLNWQKVLSFYSQNIYFSIKYKKWLFCKFVDAFLCKKYL